MSSAACGASWASPGLSSLLGGWLKQERKDTPCTFRVVALPYLLLTYTELLCRTCWLAQLRELCCLYVTFPLFCMNRRIFPCFPTNTELCPEISLRSDGLALAYGGVNVVHLKYCGCAFQHVLRTAANGTQVMRVLRLCKRGEEKKEVSRDLRQASFLILPVINN